MVEIFLRLKFKMSSYTEQPKKKYLQIELDLFKVIREEKRMQEKKRRMQEGTMRWNSMH